MSDSDSPIDGMYRDYGGIVGRLSEAGEVSLLSSADDSFRKMLLLASASYFEHRVTECVVEFVARVTSKDHVITWLVKRRVVARQYHTWFDWNQNNANQFFSMFGRACVHHMRNEVERSDFLDDSIFAFMEIGRDRNRLVHGNFGSFSLEKTSDDIYDSYRSALRFVDWVPDALWRFSSGA